MIFEALVFKVLVTGFITWAAYVFWDDLKVWSTNIISALVDLIDLAITAAMHAITYLIKVSGRVYRQVKLYARNRLSLGAVKVVSSQMEEVNIDDLPAAIREKLDLSAEVETLQTTVPV